MIPQLKYEDLLAVRIALNILVLNYALSIITEAVYLLFMKARPTGKQKKYWRCSKDKEDCSGAMWTNLEVTTVIDKKDHIDTS
ncbi:hypothetical protein T08_2050 [Trichinella sp. T8]|nr:hypothetical protein T08_2050 [Trichinella sp. T8]